jgi:hypothetical protein
MAKTQFTQREKAVLVLGVVCLVVMVGTLALRKPLQMYQESKVQVNNARLRLSDAYDLQALIETEKAYAAKIAEVYGTGGLDKSLTLVVNEVLQQTDLASKAQFRELPSTIRGLDAPLETLLVDLQGVSLEEFIDLMHALYSRDSLLILERVDYLRPAANAQGIDAQMVLSSVSNA